MATFYYNSGKNEDIVTQWVDHLQHESYVKDVNQVIEKNSKEINESIKTGSAEQVQAISNVCGQLEDMNYNLQSIDYNISELRGEINAMASMLDWKLSQMIEEQRITNQLLGFIAQLLRIPDSQKQRVYHIEQGLKYLKNAFMENDVNSSFYIDAIEDLKKAENIERKDFITLNKIGQIHLYSKTHLDFGKAEEYFLKSARESFAEYNANGTTTSNNLNPSGLNYLEMGNTKMAKTKTTLLCEKCGAQHTKWVGQCTQCKEWNTIVESLLEEENNYSLPINNFLISTVESYLLAARCCYLQRKLNKAIEYSKKAYELIPKFLSAKFDNAKYLASNNQSEKAVEILKNIISIDRYFSIKTVKDQDLITKKEITDLLERLKTESYKEAKEKYEDLKKNANNNSNANQILSEINNHLSKDNYLSHMKALDMLNSKYDLPYYQNLSKNKGHINYFGIIRQKTQQQLFLSDFLSKENNSERELTNLKEKLKKELIRERTIANAKMGGILGIVVGLLKGCATGYDFWSASTWISTIVILTIIFALIGYVIANSTNIKVEYN